MARMSDGVQVVETGNWELGLGGEDWGLGTGDRAGAGRSASLENALSTRANGQRPVRCQLLVRDTEEGAEHKVPGYKVPGGSPGGYHTVVRKCSD